MSECPICVDITILISPPAGYCDHEMCISCWVNTGERNPLCPICRCDLTEWMESLKIKINSKARFDDDENLMADFTTLAGGSLGELDIEATNRALIQMFYIGGFLRFSRLFESISEPEEDEQINPDVMRSLTGNDTYYARYDLGLSPMSDFTLPMFTTDRTIATQFTDRAIRRTSHEQLNSTATRDVLPYYRPMAVDPRQEIFRNQNTVILQSPFERLSIPQFRLIATAISFPIIPVNQELISLVNLIFQSFAESNVNRNIEQNLSVDSQRDVESSMETNLCPCHRCTGGPQPESLIIRYLIGSFRFSTDLGEDYYHEYPDTERYRRSQNTSFDIEAYTDSYYPYSFPFISDMDPYLESICRQKTIPTSRRETMNMQRWRHRNISNPKRSKNFRRQQPQTRRQKYKSRNNRM